MRIKYQALPRAPARGRMQAQQPVVAPPRYHGGDVWPRPVGKNIKPVHGNNNNNNNNNNKAPPPAQ